VNYLPSNADFIETTGRLVAELLKVAYVQLNITTPMNSVELCAALVCRTWWGDVSAREHFA